MGFSPAEVIQSAASFVVDELAIHQSFNYSRFYDGTKETEEFIRKKLSLEDDWYSAEHLLDLAIAQLEEFGIVKTTQLDSKLADDEPDYRIEWTQDGPNILTSKDLHFYDAE